MESFNLINAVVTKKMLACTKTLTNSDLTRIALILGIAELKMLIYFITLEFFKAKSVGFFFTSPIKYMLVSIVKCNNKTLLNVEFKLIYTTQYWQKTENTRPYLFLYIVVQFIHQTTGYKVHTKMTTSPAIQVFVYDT